MLRNICLLAFALTLYPSLGSAQVTLASKYPEGTKSVVHVESKSDQTLTLLGMDIGTDSSTFIVSTKTIGKRKPDGGLTIEEKIDSVQSEIALPGGLKLTFDSANPDKPAPIPQLEPLLEIFRTMCRFPFTIQLDAKDKITEVKLPDGEYEKLGEGVKDRFTPETLKKSSEQASDFLPDGPVKKGDTWERSSESNLGSGQLLSFRTKFEYEGTTEKDGVTLDKITSKTFEVNYTINGNPLLQVTKSDLKIAKADGTYLFDRERGHLVSRSSKTQIVGTLTLVANNMELPGKLDLTITETAARQK